MKINITQNQYPKLKEIDKTFTNNRRIISLYSKLLELNFLNQSYLRNELNIKNITETEFALVLASILGLNYEVSDDLELIKGYILPYFSELKKDLYSNNPYYSNIKVKNKTFKNWKFQTNKYLPYQPFIYGEYIVDGYKEIPSLGYFTEAFSYPEVLQDDNQWMLITPNEIETMKEAIFLATGNVVTFGLGMGYFAYMVSNKEEVNKVTIVEKDKNVIRLFTENILPQFPNKNKIEIIESDAFDYILSGNKHDFAFCDIWHDVSDGLPLYIKFKKLEVNWPMTKFTYWIENMIVAQIRYAIYVVLFDELDGINKTYNDSFINKVKKALNDYQIDNLEQFEYCLTNEFIVKLITKL